MPGRILWMVVTLCLLVTPLAMAGDSPVVPAPASALEFRVADDFTLSSFSGSTLSWKHLSSENRGWRLGLSPTFSDSDTDDTQGEMSREQGRNLYSLELEMQRLHLGSLNRGVRGYWGYGPQVSFRYDESRSQTMDAVGGVTDERLTLQRSWGLGAAALVGVEYFFRPGMSLMGEYGLDIWYRHVSSRASSSSSSSSPPEIKREDWSLGGSGVRLGLSVVY